jgi:hypothetical protein
MHILTTGLFWEFQSNVRIDLYRKGSALAYINGLVTLVAPSTEGDMG